MNRNEPIKLRIPRQDQAEFTLFETTGEGAKKWTQGLALTNGRAVVQQLRQVIGDLNRVELSPETRHEILESLRPTIQVATFNLSRRFLNQPLVMPEEPRQVAALADSLFGLTATAYTIVAIQAIKQKDQIRNINPARLVCEAIHRAIRFEGRKILQSFQLYRPVEFNGWLTLHQLYALAESQQLARLQVPDRLDDEGTITDAYVQVLMLGCCKPNQLRQTDLAGIYRGFQEWNNLIKLEPAETGQGLFLVDMDTDQPPQYSALYGDDKGTNCRSLDTSPLIKHLERLRAADDEQGKPGLSFDRDTSLPSNILHHLIAALGSMSQRNFTRIASDSAIWVTIGLSSTHFHVAGETPFETLLHGEDYIPPAAERLPDNPFLRDESTADQWQQANPEEDFASRDDPNKSAAEIAAEHQIEMDDKTRAALQDNAEAPPPSTAKYPVFPVQMVNASPGGYCLDWSAELPATIRTGDIVGVLEEHNREWVIAVIRWVSQLKASRTLVGLELLSPHALPYGADIQQKTGARQDPMRVLLLPEIKLVGQPHTLITPRLTFKEGQKITLQGNGEEFYIQLLRQVAATGSFAQFDFRYIKQLVDVVTEATAEPLQTAYDSLWSNI